MIDYEMVGRYLVESKHSKRVHEMYEDQLRVEFAKGKNIGTPSEIKDMIHVFARGNSNILYTYGKWRKTYVQDIYYRTISEGISDIIASDDKAMTLMKFTPWFVEILESSQAKIKKLVAALEKFRENLVVNFEKPTDCTLDFIVTYFDKYSPEQQKQICSILTDYFCEEALFDLLCTAKYEMFSNV